MEVVVTKEVPVEVERVVIKEVEKVKEVRECGLGVCGWRLRVACRVQAEARTRTGARGEDRDEGGGEDRVRGQADRDREDQGGDVRGPVLLSVCVCGGRVGMPGVDL